MPRETSRPTDTALGHQRQRFLDVLEPRLDALLEALKALAAHPAHTSLRDQLEQRFEAMADAASTLGFEQMATAFASAQSVLACSTDPATTARAVNDASATLSLIPGLVDNRTTHADASTVREPVQPPAPRQVSSLTTTSTDAEAAERTQPSAHSVAQAKPVVRRPRLCPGTVVVLGVLPLQATCKRWGQEFPELSFHFTVDVDDAASLVADLERPVVIVDARRPDVGHAFHRLSEHGPCVLVEATARQQRGFEAQGAHAALSPGISIDPIFTELFTEPAEKQASPEPSAPTPDHESPPNRGAARRAPRAEVVALPGRTILVADADPATAWFLSGLLRSVQATVLEARDGLEAWHLAQERQPDLVISDLALPELDGFGLCRNVKRDVALSDVPVLLVSWKEDALHRARELGAGADGYFVKEADSATVLRRAAEALQTRVHVENRLRQERTVRGRLQGMTPRLVLKLASELVGEARITFVDAAYTYTAYVGDGRLLAASRTSPDGTTASGQDVLPSLLGMRASRFVVEPHDEVVQSTFVGSMSATLAPTIARIRRSMRVLAGDSLHKVARVELEAAVVNPYVDASPAIVRRVVDKLAAGVPPLSLTRGVSPGLLESVLADLGLRGGVRAAIDINGADLLQSGDPLNQPFDLELSTPTSGFELQAAPGAPRIDANSTATDAQRAAEFASNQATKPETLVAKASTNATESGAPAAELTADVGNVSDDARINDAPVGAAPSSFHDANQTPPSAKPVTLIPRPEPTEDAVDWAPTVGELLQTGQDVDAELDAPTSAPDVKTPTEAAEPDGSAPRAFDAPIIATDESTSATSERDERLREVAATADLTSERERRSDPGVMSAARVTDNDLGGDTNPNAEDLECDERAQAAEGSRPGRPEESRIASAAPAPPSTETSELDLADALLGVAAFDSAPSVAPEAPRKREATVEASDTPSELPNKLVVSTRLSDQAKTFEDDFIDEDDPLFSSLHLVESEPSAKANTIKTNPLHDEGHSTQPPKARIHPKTSLDERVTAWSSKARAASKLAVEWVRRKRRAPTMGATQAPAGATDDDNADTQSTVDRITAATVGGRSPSTSGDLGSRAPKKPAPAASQQPTARATRDADADETFATSEPFTERFTRARAVTRKGLPVVAVMATAGLAFSGVSAIVERIESTQVVADATAQMQVEEPASDATLDPAAAEDLVSHSVAPPGATPAKARVEMNTTELPMPEGVEIAAGKGLLEVNSGDGHKIYVNGVFVGRGPVRRVPLAAGKHQIELRNDGEVDKFEVSINDGKRVRLEPAAHAAVSP